MSEVKITKGIDVRTTNAAGLTTDSYPDATRFVIGTDDALSVKIGNRVIAFYPAGKFHSAVDHHGRLVEQNKAAES